MRLPSRLGWSLGLITLLFICSSATAAAQTPRITAANLGLKPFIAPLQSDTLLHGIAGAMSGFFVASAGAMVYNKSEVRAYPLLLPALGASAAVLAGIGKETLDSTGFGDPQWRDLIHTVIGGLLAAGVVAAVERSGGNLASTREQARLYAGLGVSFAVPIAAGMLDEVRLYLVKRRLQK